jgi:hypothetical protein
VAEALFIVGAGVDVTAVKAHLTSVVAMPVIAPEEPQLALARGAALASANAPRYDASTVGLAYSQDPDGPTAPSISAIDFVGHDGAFLDAAANASDPHAPDRSKPFLVGSSLAAVFIAGMIALTIAVAVNVRPTADQDANPMPVHPGTPAPVPARQSAPPAAAKDVPDVIPAPAAGAPADAVIAKAQEVPPAPPPPVVVRDVAPPAVAAPPAPAAPPPFVVPPPVIQWPVPWVPPILQPPPYYGPRPHSPPRGQWPGDRGSHHGHGGD